MTKRLQSNIDDQVLPNSDLARFCCVLPGDKKSMRLLASVYDRVGNTEWLNNGPFEQK